MYFTDACPGPVTVIADEVDVVRISRGTFPSASSMNCSLIVDSGSDFFGVNVTVPALDTRVAVFIFDGESRYVGVDTGCHTAYAYFYLCGARVLFALCTAVRFVICHLVP